MSLPLRRAAPDEPGLMGRVLIAGMGNVLLRDDGFGVEVAKRLGSHERPSGAVRVVDIGIGGIHLVHELMKGYDSLVVLDAMDRGDRPGALQLLELEVPDLTTWPVEERQDFLADMHYAVPSRALVLAKAVGVLPPRVYLLGCRPEDISDLGIGLSKPVQQAVEMAVREIDRILDSLLEEGSDGKSCP